MNPIEAALQAALALAARGFPVFPCSNDKSPTCSGGFKSAPRDVNAVRALWASSPGVLVGIPTGEASGIAVLDIDSVKHREAVDWLQQHGSRLGETWIVETRSGGQHWYFQHRLGLRCSASKIATGIDVRADGGYVVAWSAHGCPVLQNAPLAPWPAFLDEILDARRDIGVSALPSPDALKATDREALSAIVRQMPNDKTFDDRAVWVGLAHSLAAAFAEDPATAEELWHEHSAKRVQTPGEPERVWDSLQGPHSVGVRWIVAKANAAGIDTRPYEVAEAKASMAAAGPILVNPNATTAPLLGPVEQQIAEFNRRYMVVNEAGKAIIYEPVHDPLLNRRYYSRITFEDFRRLYLNRLLPVSDKFKPAGEIWLHHTDRRQYLGGVMFDPSCRHVRDDTLNLWQGFAVQPRPGSWVRLREHILCVICNGNDGHLHYLIGWMARLVQHPAEQGEVAIVMRGGEGTGKGTLAKILLYILGQHGLAISNSKHLTGNFNGHLRDTVLLFADEAFFAGDKAHVGVLKSLITEPFLTVEAKYQNAVQMSNFVHLMMASNEQWVVPASLDARRFFVLEVSDAHANDHAWFAAIWDEMKSGGFEALLYDLMNYDLTAFNLRRVPVTEGLHEQRKLSLGTPENWWLDCLHRGAAIYSWSDEWRGECTTELLYASYRDFARRANDRHPLSREMFGRFMVRMGAKPKRLTVPMHLAPPPPASNSPPGIPGPIANTNTTTGPDGGAASPSQRRPPGYILGSLSDARAAFCKVTGLAVEWPDDGDQADEP